MCQAVAISISLLKNKHVARVMICMARLVMNSILGPSVCCSNSLLQSNLLLTETPLLLAGTEQWKIQERLAPRRRQLRQTENVRGVVPVPLQRRRPRPRSKAHQRGLSGRLQGLHIRRVLQQVLEQEPGPRTLLGTLQNLAPLRACFRICFLYGGPFLCGVAVGSVL
jgi:hypothetical protein